MELALYVGTGVFYNKKDGCSVGFYFCLGCVVVKGM